MTKPALAFLLAAALATTTAAVPAHAAEPRLVRDVAPSFGHGSSNPRHLVGLGDRIVFDAADPTHGRELWVSDGTPEGSRLLVDICPGTCGTWFRWQWAAAGRWFFEAVPDFPRSTEGSGAAAVPGQGLWSTDGTRAGTHFLGDLDNVVHLETLEALGLHLFIAEDDAHGLEPWRTDGTSGGTWRLADFNPGPADSVTGSCFGAAAMGGYLLFAVRTPREGCELWRTDGSPEGTALVRDVVPGAGGSFPGDLASLGDRVVFTAFDETHGVELWRSDGTRAGTAVVTEIVPGRASAFFSDGLGRGIRSVNGRGYFLAGRRTVRDPSSGFDLPLYELWQTDGTATGTRQLTRFNSRTAFRLDPLSDPDFPYYLYLRLGVVGTTIYFSADDGKIGRELWTSDGTAAGTRLLADLCPGSCDSNPVLFRPLGDDGVFFQARDEVHGAEAWISDGTAGGTRRVEDLCPGDCGSLVTGRQPLGDRVVFAAVSSVPGEAPPQLWSAAVTAANTRELQVWSFEDAFQDSNDLFTTVTVPMARLGDEILFTVDDGVHGRELWATAGTPGSTRLLADLVGPVGVGSEPARLTRHGSALYFVADDGERGFELWSTDGTAAGTQPVLDTPPTCATCSNVFGRLHSIGDLLYYRVGGGDDRLWRSDGTAAGTFVLLEARDVRDAFGELAGEVYFAAANGLWKTDGTVAGTARVGDAEFRRPPTSFHLLGDELFFHAAGESYASTLWKTDGTAAGTREVSRALADTGPSYPTSILELGGRIVFSGTGDGSDYDLWVSDGTDAGTRPLTDFVADGNASRIALLGSVGGRVVFQAFTPGGVGLWAADATGAALRLRDLHGSAGWPLVARSRGGEALYLLLDDGVHGRELWRTDGTPQGTRLVRDVFPGPLSSSPSPPEQAGDRVVFAATHPTGGRQLWVSDGTAGGTVPVTSSASGLAFPPYPDAGDASWLGDRILFVAADAEHGEELWSLPLGAGPADPPDGPPPGGDGDPPPPAGTWLESGAVPGFRFKVRIAQGAGASIAGTGEPACIPETLCVSGALPGRSEVFLRVVGPRPNGKLWPTLVKFTTSEVEVWIEQLATGALRYYRLEGARPGVDELPGLFDRDGFDP